MVRRIRPARHYQHPEAPIRRIMDAGRLPTARAFKAALRAARRLFDAPKAAYLISNGRYREVVGIIDWNHANEAMRQPLAMVGDVRQVASQLGARKINGAFTSRGRKVRYKKAAGTGERATHASRWSDHHPEGPPSVPSEAILKDQADLFNFDRFDPETQRRIRAYQDLFITELTKDSRKAVEGIILRALLLGLPAAEIAEQVRLVIGLTERQAMAVLRFREQLMSLDPKALARALVGGADVQIIRRAINDGQPLDRETLDAIVRRYEENYLDSRALTIATTELTRAAAMGLQDSYEQAIERGAMPREAVRQFWQLDLDERTCEHCLSVVDMNPDGVPLGDMFDSDEGPVDAPGLHPNCVPGDTLVIPAGRVLAATKRWFDGDVIVIRTASGKELTSTPNHPILTAAGWVHSHLVQEGHHVVSRCLGDGIGAAGSDGENMPARIEDVAEAFGCSAEVTAVPVPTSSKDFHGDGAGSKIAIVWADRLLRNGDHAAGKEERGEMTFGRAGMKALGHYGLRALHLLFHGVLTAAHRRVSLGGLQISGSGIHALPFERLGFGLTADVNPALHQPKADGGATDGKVLSDRLFREPGLVQFDHVVNVQRKPFRGHVFNLQTEEGYYVADGIYTHNCRCSLEIVTNLDLVPSSYWEDAA